MTNSVAVAKERKTLLGLHPRLDSIQQHELTLGQFLREHHVVRASCAHCPALKLISFPNRHITVGIAGKVKHEEGKLRRVRTCKERKKDRKRGQRCRLACTTAYHSDTESTHHIP